MSCLSIRPLLSTDQLSDFFCGIEVMDEFIHDGLNESLIQHNCLSYIITDEAGLVVAFFALGKEQLVLDDGDKDDLLSGISDSPIPSFQDSDEREAFLQKSVFPSVDISYLAVKCDCQRKGIGSTIIRHIFGKSKEMFPECMFLTVDALILRDIKYSAVEFYEKFGFQRLYPPTSENTIRLYCTLYPSE